jgi:hypothetical protein
MILNYIVIIKKRTAKIIDERITDGILIQNIVGKYLMS